MKPVTPAFFLAIVFAFVSNGVTSGSILEVGDLNIINDAGNASDGLRYLDMTYSVGLSSAAALANAQDTYANARLATAAEFDDLFLAAGINYDGAETAADGFTAGPTVNISQLGYDAGTLRDQLGVTYLPTQVTRIWTDPDSSSASTSSRDLLSLSGSSAVLWQTASPFPRETFGWLIVSEANAGAVPEPASLMCWLGLGLVGLTRCRRKQ